MSVNPPSASGECAGTLRRTKQRQPHHPEAIHFVRTSDPLGHIRTEGEPDKVLLCVSLLESLRLPLESGRDKARQVLRQEGHAFSNAVICEAIKLRKEGGPVPDSTTPVPDGCPT